MPSDRPTAVRLLVPDNPMMPFTVRGRLEARRKELGEELAYGSASDWADYQRRIGVIDGLKEAIAICLEIEKEMN